MLESLLLFTVINTCSWDSPGVNRYTGDLVKSIDNFNFPPKDKLVLKWKLKAHDYDDIVTISSFDIKGENFRYTPELTYMHFGNKSVCKTVNRNWGPTKTESGLVYCSGESCVVVPAVCGNVSRIVRTGNQPEIAAKTSPESVRSDSARKPGVFVIPPSISIPEVPALPSPLILPEVSVQFPWLTLPRPLPYRSPDPTKSIPEPGTWTLVVIGLLLLFLNRKS